MTLAAGTRVTDAATVMVVTSVTFNERITAAGTLTAINYPSPTERTTQAVVGIVASPQLMVRSTQADVLVAILRGAEERLLRAWTFTQDDHDFYVLQAAAETYVYDNLTSTWSQWQSPDAQNYWKGSDGTDWNGINVCCDPDSDAIYLIDPTNRLDYNTTPITSVVYGGMTERFRNITSCFMGELAISQATPPAGIDGTTVGITLESTDTITWFNHGTVQGSGAGSPTWVRWYGLGLLTPPGRLFKITDTGLARRIDGFTIETNGKEE
jgi:hypothetical protein